MYSLYEVEQILRNKQVFVCSLAFLGEGEHSEAFLVNRGYRGKVAETPAGQ